MRYFEESVEGFILTSAQGRAVVMDDVSGADLSSKFRSVATRAVADLETRHRGSSPEEGASRTSQAPSQRRA